jgi:hypothetical protein
VKKKNVHRKKKGRKGNAGREANESEENRRGKYEIERNKGEKEGKSFFS